MRHPGAVLLAVLLLVPLPLSAAAEETAGPIAPAGAPASPAEAMPTPPPAPTLLETLWEKGERALSEGRTDDARQAFQEALSLDPANGRTLNYLGGVFFVRGEWSQALARFKQAAEAIPGDPRIFNNLATACDKLGQYPDAIENYLAAIALAPEYAVPYRNLGAIYAYKARDLDLAEKYWMAFLQLAPDSPERSNILGELERLKRVR